MKALKSNIKFLIKKPQCWFSPSFSFSSETLDANPIEKDPVFENKKKFPKKISQFSLSPHVFWLTQGKGMERPYTGDYWFTKEVGHYQCLTCSNKLFLSEHKFFPPTGMASFWTHLPNSLNIVNDLSDVKENFDNINENRYKENSQKQRCACSQCRSHLGLVYMDGPPPTFLRFNINSGALKFVEKPWFENPLRIKERKNENKLKKKLKNKEIRLPDFGLVRKSVDK